MNVSNTSSVAASDAPLVSVVMLAYNQRELVGEAMASLLAQDYPNYELIVSDDNSTDGTFDEMGRIVAGHDGRPTVSINQTTANRGTLSHLYEAVALSRGRFIVVAGGDDISLPHRVSTLVAAWRATGAQAMFSGCTVVDAERRPILDGTVWLDEATQSFFPRRLAYKISGAMAAYDRNVFEELTLPAEPIYSEDVFFSLMIHYNNGLIATVPDRLVLYRNHENSFSNSHGSRISVANAEVKAQRLIRDQWAILCRFRLMVEEARHQGRTDDVDLAAVRRMEDFYDYAAHWIELPISLRLRRLGLIRSRHHLRWALLRLFGLPWFVRFKGFQRSFRSA